MISRKNRIRKANVLATGGLMLFVLCFFTDGIRAEERKFVVMMAHSPKAFVTNGVPGLPPGGLTDVEIIRKDYFDISDDHRFVCRILGRNQLRRSDHRHLVCRVRMDLAAMGDRTKRAEPPGAQFTG
ncbi:MAG: hypothetical protein IIB57_15305 [Planctomycetes bacterium]|nr:hypothetical protein [Planctomycetota bacterium]